MSKDYDYIVIGLGALGSAALYWLSRRAGSKVLGLEQFQLGHDRGASHDHSRIIRLSYHTTEWVRLAQQAYAAWAEVSERSGEELVLQTGGIDVEPPNSAQPLDDFFASLTACDVPFEVLDKAELKRRWPQFHLENGTRALYQKNGGFVAATRANTAHISLARANGANIFDNTPVTSIRTAGSDIEVVTDDQTYRCRKVIIAADAWTNNLLEHVGMRIPLFITQEQVTYFSSPKSADFAMGLFPAWIWQDEPTFYGFPVFGEQAVKVAQDMGGKPVTPETRTFTPDEDTLSRVQSFVSKHMPDALGPILYTKTCIYAMPPDRDFVIDSLPGHDNIFVAQGAAHAFKFASLIGKILSELALDGTCNSDISPFAIDRPAIANYDPTAPLKYLR